MIPTVVASGAEALNVLKETQETGEPFSLVLLDNMMPEMDGFELAEHIKHNPELTPATMMMISSAGRREDALRCKQVGVSAYMCKPIRRVELMSGILEALSLTDQETEGRRSPARLAADRAASSLRILLTEDNVVNQKLAVRLLEKRGHRVSEGSSRGATTFCRRSSPSSFPDLCWDLFWRPSWRPRSRRR
jgi:CheY-like chemotaxis protein